MLVFTRNFLVLKKIIDKNKELNTTVNFRFAFLKSAVLVSVLSVLALTFTMHSTNAQTDPLTLADVLTALQSKSSGLTLAQKNSFITKRVQERGVTFRLTTDLENELRSAGASVALLNAIRLKAPRATPTPTPKTTTGTAPTVKFNRIWVDYNVTEDDAKGMRIHTAFTVNNMMDIPGYLAVYFEKKNGDKLTSKDDKYSSKGGQVAVFRKITPAYNSAVYSDFSTFIPYTEFELPPGDYDLKLDADLIYEDGNLIQHLDFYEFVFKNPKPTQTTSNAIITFDKMWIDYDVTEGGKRGMRVHVKMNIQNMVGIESYLAVYFEKQNGDKLYSDNDTYRSKGGQTALYRSLNPPYQSSDWNDIAMFIPYDEFNLTKGTYDLRIHSDLIYPNGDLIKHLNYYNFRYTKK